MEQKIEKNIFAFQIIAFELVVAKFSQSSTGYLPSGVNALTNTPKKSPNTMGDNSEMNFHKNDKET